ncbi:polygalacturonase protein [Spatholobus suberectus]|nr:polygalacturonase protein [Spatholobus suberectus]
MKIFFVVLGMFVVASPCLCARMKLDAGPNFDVIDYGAMGNGQTDDSQAFLNAWKDACDATHGTPTLLVPQGKTFMLQPLLFRGPCKPAIVNIKLKGTIIAPNSTEAWKLPKSIRKAWIRFKCISGLVIHGGDKLMAKVLHGGIPMLVAKLTGQPVGSLGKKGAHETVEEIYVRNCTFNGTTNGARIKTWMGGQGYARKITFKDIILVNVENPVIIDQQYNPYDSLHAVRVSDVSYHNVRGTSSFAHAVKLHCDKTIGCTNIVLKRINITTITGDKTYASCKNAKGMCFSCIPHVPCLSHE